MNALILVVVLGSAYLVNAGVVDSGYSGSEASEDGGAALQLAAGGGGAHGLDGGSSGDGGSGSSVDVHAHAQLQLAAAAASAGHGLESNGAGNLQLDNTVQINGGHGYELGGDLGTGHHDFSPKVEHHHVPVQTIVQTKPVPVEVIKKIGVPVPHPVPVHVPHIIKVLVPQPYPVHVNVPHLVPVPIYKLQPKEIERKVPIEVEKIIPYPVEKPFKVEVAKPIPIPVPVYKNIYHHAPKHTKWA